MARVVLVHGMWNFVPGAGAEEAAGEKAAAARPYLAQGMRKAGLTGPVPEPAMAYYADLLDRVRPAGAQAAGAPPGFEALSEPEREVAAQWLVAAGAPVPPQLQNIAVAPLRQLVGWLVDDRTGPIARRLRDGIVGRLERAVVGVLHEVRAYTAAPDGAGSGPRVLVRERVAEVIRRERPQVVVAHSLGSVVAYETLHAHPDLEVPQLVTIGSPLRLPVLADRLDPGLRGGRGARPSGVRHWTNIADVGDLVAVPPKLADVFPVDQDESVDNGIDFHGLHSYLANGLTALAVLPYLS
ncbi:hypothetical protein ACFXD5_05850 [Streptomyces sp. NPDC059385]|uniref:hypothetical protein n=1 Tax=Streptomyces sp. NPDC059385 TaxID=3346817 RepID=UPI00368E44F8